MLNWPLEKVIRTTASHLKKCHQLGIFTAQDLLGWFPRALESTEIGTGVKDIELGKKNTLTGTLQNFRKERTRGGKYLGKATLVLDDRAELEVIWFRVPYQLKNLQLPRRCFLVGKIDRRYGKIQINNPEIHLNEGVHVGGIRPIYPESPPLTSKWLREKISGLLGSVREFPETLPDTILSSEGLLSRTRAIRQIHFPDSVADWSAARRRLGFEEIFLIQLRVMQAKFQREENHQNPHRFHFDPEMIKQDLTYLPFTLTTHQKQALLEVLQDFKRDRPMHRLLQGDVGAGKTIVGLMAALQMSRAVYQTALLAPTEILAKQHFVSALKFLSRYQEFADQDTLLADEKMPTDKIALLTGSTTAKQKKDIKARLRQGEIKILIGTHAILTEDTIFQDLGLAIIDEQHRFGVAQRAILSENQSHVLAMTATPIPRSLALTIYGDQDLSIIREKPAGRKPIITRIVADKKTETLCYRFIEDQVTKGRQVFWVCPLVDESDKIEAKNVHDEYVRISETLYPKLNIGFLHGKMKSKDKDAIMEAFKNQEYDILVSTSVIEVGVDVPNATVMVIENSERFGLAQLHQFRGRIGRNDMQSYCFLMVGSQEDKSKERLKAMERSNDGFYLSEVDLELRGAGEIYGLRQSGLPDLKCADLTDVELMQTARGWAEKILTEDITLRTYPELKAMVEAGEVWF